HRFVVDDAAQRARGEDIRLDAEDAVVLHRLRAEVFDDALHFPAIDVGDDELRARLMELLAQVRADVPEALDGDHLALERIGSPSMVGRRLDRTEHATRRYRRRVARPVREAADVLR